MSKFMNVAVDSQSNVVTRDSIPPFTLFKVKGKDTVYANVGKRTVPPSAEPGYQSIIVSGPKAGECAHTTNGKSAVQVVGTWKINALLAADFASLASSL